MPKNWSKDSRERQGKTINSHKPWQNSTGPKSDEGKQRSSRNSDKGKTPLRTIQKMITKVHKERIELTRWLDKEFGISIKF